MLPRLRPDTSAAVRPVYEYRAAGRTHEIYADIKRTLEVPWVGVLMLAYARYPTFFDQLWQGLRPVVAGGRLVADAMDLRVMVEDEIDRLHPPPLTAALTDMGYAARELDEIRNIIEIFSHGNYPYLLIATIARLLIEDGTFGGPETGPVDPPRAPALLAPFVMVEEHHGNGELRAQYAAMKRSLGLPFINSDYRALARWPSYFDRAWGDLAPHVGGAAHEALCQKVHNRALELVAALPNPLPLTAAALRSAAAADATVDDLRAVCRLFQHLLPGLTVNVGFFRAQLSP